MSPAQSKAMQAFVMAVMPEDMTKVPLPFSKAASSSASIRFVGILSRI